MISGITGGRSAPEVARRHAEQIEYLTLQRSELGLEALHNATSAAEQVPLSVAEQPQELFGGRVVGRAQRRSSGYSGSAFSRSRFIVCRSSRSMSAWMSSARK